MTPKKGVKFTNHFIPTVLAEGLSVGFENTTREWYFWECALSALGYGKIESQVQFILVELNRTQASAAISVVNLPKTGSATVRSPPPRDPELKTHRSRGGGSLTLI